MIQKFFRTGAACVATVAVSIASQSVCAQPADTLARIRSTRTIVLGVRDAARPFSYLDADKRSVGYSVDLCLNAVEEIRRELKLPDLKVAYRVVSAAERIPKLLSNDIDLECGSTTNTKARQQQVAFSYTFFVASMRILAPKSMRIETIKDLDGVPIGLSKGTTSEKLFTQLTTGELHAPIQVYGNNGDAYLALKQGKVKAFPQDDSLLLGLVSADQALGQWGLSDLALSVEPYALMVRKSDPALLALVDRSLARLFASGEINAVYGRWFATEALTIKMGRLTRDSFTRPNKEPGVAMLLGYSI